MLVSSFLFCFYFSYVEISLRGGEKRLWDTDIMIKKHLGVFFFLLHFFTYHPSSDHSSSVLLSSILPLTWFLHLPFTNSLIYTRLLNSFIYKQYVEFVMVENFTNFIQFYFLVSVVVQLLSHVWLCDPMDCSTPGCYEHSCTSFCMHLCFQ